MDGEGNQTEGWWKDAELRSYCFVRRGEEARLEETMESKVGRKERDSALEGETERLSN